MCLSHYDLRKVSPEQLFERHSEQATRRAETLCWHYRVGGAMSYTDEAVSEASLALWSAARRFDPDKQQLQNRSAKRHADEQFWDVVSQGDFESKTDPYLMFWPWASIRVNGSVLDLFRQLRIITRAPSTMPCPQCGTTVAVRKGVYECGTCGFAEKRTTIPLPAMILSLSAAPGESAPTKWNSKGGAPSGKSYANVIAAPDVEREREEREHLEGSVKWLLSQAHLTRAEVNAVRAKFFGEYANPRRPQPPHRSVVEAALSKLRRAALGADPGCGEISCLFTPHVAK